MAYTQKSIVNGEIYIVRISSFLHIPKYIDKIRTVNDMYTLSDKYLQTVNATMDNTSMCSRTNSMMSSGGGTSAASGTSVRSNKYKEYYGFFSAMIVTQRSLLVVYPHKEAPC